jgi:flagellar biosynthesis regulator FlaF
VEWNAVWNVVQAVGTIVAIIVAVKAMKRDETSSTVRAIFADGLWQSMIEKLHQDALTAARSAAADRMTVLINEKTFVLREVQEVMNREIFRRLAAVEKKIDDVPEATAEQVILKMREAQR